MDAFCDRMTVVMEEILGIALGEFVIASVTLLAVFVALFIGVSTLIQSAKLQKREYKAKRLDEIKKWALDLQYVNVPNTPSISELWVAAKAGAQGEKARDALAKAEGSLRMSRVLFEGSYIRELAEKVFKKELGDTFRTIDSEVAATTYLESKDAGTPLVVSPSDREIVQKLEGDLASGSKTLEQLLAEHRQLLIKLAGELLVKIADVKAKLL